MSDVCHQTVIDGDAELAPCDAPASGVRFDVMNGGTYPVCSAHLCGGCGLHHDECTPIPLPTPIDVPTRRYLDRESGYDTAVKEYEPSCGNVKPPKMR